MTTKIEWTRDADGSPGKSWNPVRGCSRCSPGCGGGTPGPGTGGCYAERQAIRMSNPGGAYEDLVKMTAQGPRWTGEVKLIPGKLAAPLRWRKPATIFVNSMSDLFHEKLTFEEIAAVVGVMAACPQHRFMTLTKRAERMREWCDWVWMMRDTGNGSPAQVCADKARSALDRATQLEKLSVNAPGRENSHRAAIGKIDEQKVPPWPLPNWRLGVSAEDQKRWDERVPELLRCPAAFRFVSAEPLLGTIDLSDASTLCRPCASCLSGQFRSPCPDCAALDLVIVGGESGPNSRPCRLELVDSIVEQCREAGVAVFVKQLGAWPTKSKCRALDKDPNCRYELLSRKGGDPSEWPGGLERFPRDGI